MSSALKPVLTPSGTQNPSVPAQMNKQMHPQGTPAAYAQQSAHMPQNLVNITHNNPNPAHNLPPNQNHYSSTLNVPNSYSGNPPASSHPVASNHPIPNQAHSQPISYSPPKNPTFNTSYQIQHNIPASQTLPATQAQSAAIPEQEKPQSNGTAELKTNKTEQNHVTTPKKEMPQSPEKAKISPEKPSFSASTASEAKTSDVKPAVETAQVPQNVAAPPQATASTTTSTSSSSPAAPTSAATSTSATPPTPAVVPPTPAPVTSSTPTITIPPLINVTVIPPKSEPSVAATVESSTPATASSPTSTATTTPAVAASTTTAAVAAVPVEETPSIVEPTPPVTAPIDNPDDEPQEAESTTADAPASPSKPKEQSTPTKVSPMKLATTPRTPTRKSKTPSKPETDSPKPAKVVVEPKPSSSKTPSGKMKRSRVRTQPYQSPLPEIEIITKMTNPTNTPKSKSTDEKLIIFYKNEFLAVRNSEGGFYICQAVQNVYKHSPKIRIRWLSPDKQDKTGEIFTPDFYDNTDFDCILTNLNLERVDKGMYKLPPKEKERTDNILKRAIAVEKGEATSLDDSLTEDNPDGLDVSLYKDEEQLMKKGTKRKTVSKLTKTPSRTPSSRKSPEQAKVKKMTPKASKVAKTPKKTPAVVKKAIVAEVKKSTPVSGGRSERAKRRGTDTPNMKSSPVLDQKKAKVLAKVAKRTAVASPVKVTPKKVVVSKAAKQPVPSTSKAKTTPKAAAVTTPPSRRSTKRTRK